MSMEMLLAMTCMLVALATNPLCGFTSVLGLSPRIAFPIHVGCIFGVVFFTMLEMTGSFWVALVSGFVVWAVYMFLATYLGCLLSKQEERDIGRDLC